METPRFFVWLSATLNMSAGGNVDNTLSSRLYYLDTFHDRDTELREAVDWAFYPLEGEGHCKRAYKKDPTETFLPLNNWYLFVLIPALLVVLPLVRLYGEGVRLWKILK